MSSPRTKIRSLPVPTGLLFAAVMVLGCGPKHLRWEQPDGVVTERIMSRDRGLRSCDENGNYAPHCDCESDGDCDREPGGECHVGFAGGGTTGYDPGIVQSCRYPDCQDDSDCGDHALCVPAGFIAAVNTCMRVSCTSNADCARPDGATGHCRMMMARGGSREAHCLYPDSDCGAVDGAVCPPVVDANDYHRDQMCVFADGAPTCVPVPEPVP